MEYQEDMYEDELDLIQSRHSRKKKNTTPKRRSKSRTPKLGFFIVLIILLTAGIWTFQKTKAQNEFWTISVFGVDSRDGRTGKGALADVQIIASINQKTGEIRLASVFRDTYLQMNADGDYNKINEAYFLGGYEQAVTALQDNLDLAIDDCVTFNWKAVADAINVLGGIDLEITDQEFSYINSFITETVESTGVASAHLTQSGMNHLDGVQAVAYARLRLMDTDFKRTERQRKVIGLAMEKAKQANFKTLKTLVGTVYPEIFTTISVDDLLMLVKNAKKYYIGQTSGFPFAHTEMKISKKSCVVPATLESNVTQLHAFLYDDTDYTPSDLVKHISAHISKVSGVKESGKDTESGKNIGAQDHTGSSQTAAAPAESTAPPAAEIAGSEEIQTETAAAESESGAEEETTTEETSEQPETESASDTTPENMEQGPGVSTPNRVLGPNTEDHASSKEPGHVAPGDAVTGPGAVRTEDQSGGSPTVNAGSSSQNALQGPPGESTAPTKSAVTGIKPRDLLP